MKLSQLMLVGAVALLLVPVATAQTEPSPEDELLRELRAMRTRLSDMEARLTQAQAEYQQTITELKQELEELKAAQSPGAAQTGEEELDAPRRFDGNRARRNGAHGHPQYVDGPRDSEL